MHSPRGRHGSHFNGERNIGAFGAIITSSTPVAMGFLVIPGSEHFGVSAGQFLIYFTLFLLTSAALFGISEEITAGHWGFPWARAAANMPVRHAAEKADNKCLLNVADLIRSSLQSTYFRTDRAFVKWLIAAEGSDRSPERLKASSFHRVMNT